MGPRRDLHPQPMPSRGTALLLSYEDQSKEVRTRTSEAEADVIHGYSFLRETKNSRSLITILSNSKKGTRVLNIRKSRGSILIPGRFIQEIQALNYLVHDRVTTV